MFYLITNILQAGELDRMTCCKQRFWQVVTCIRGVRGEECHG